MIIKKCPAFLILGFAVVLLLSSCTASDQRMSTTDLPGASAVPTGIPATAAPVREPPTTVAPSTTTEPAELLGPGDSGPQVLALQQRLTSLGYWLGTPNGTFGDSTEQAVFALQKAAGLSRDGIVGPKTENALLAGIVPHPRETSGAVIEVDLTDDLLMFVTNGRLEDVLNTSTGGGYTYTEQRVTAIADTPVGQFRIYRQVDGLVTDSLGQLWRPKFFDDGFAIHGDSSVPPYPVSHGCVRVSNEAIDWIWSDEMAPVGTLVWIY